MPESSISLKRLDRKHRDWETYHDVWDQIELLNMGGIVLKRKADVFLIKKPKEVFDVFQERVRRFVYQNLLGNCVGWYIAKLFQREPVIDPKIKDDAIDSFLMDCDRAGTSFTDFFRRVLQYQMLYKTAYVLIDKPQPGDATVQTRADEKNLGLDQPYLVLYDPRQVINWDADSYGNLNWIVIRFVELIQDDPFAKQLTRHVWLIFDRTKFYRYEYDEPIQEIKSSTALFDPAGNFTGQSEQLSATLKTSGTHALSSENRVPVQVLSVPDTLWLSNRAFLHLWDHLDTENTYSWKLFMCNLPLLVVSGEANLHNVTLSEAAFLHLTDPQAKVFYVEPNAATFSESRERLDSLREEIYRDFYLQAQARKSNATAQGASGYSKQMDMAPANDILNAFGDCTRAGMQAVLMDRNTASGIDTSDVDIQMPDIQGFRFEVKPAMEDITTSQAVTDLGITDKSPTLEKELDKRVALTLLDDANEDTKNKVIAEIDSAPTRKETQDANELAQVQSFQQRFQRQTATGVLDAEKQSIAA